MKTPDEIKRALDCCSYLHPVCEECPYYPTFCDNVMIKDALEYIQQLEADNARQHEKIRVLELSQHAINATSIEQEHKIWQLEAERDAAVKDMTDMACYVIDDSCEWCDKANCKGCISCLNFKWRGVQKEE